MAARVSKVTAETVIPYVAPSPTSPTGVGITKVTMEALVRGDGGAHVTQVGFEAIILPVYGSHGDTAQGTTVTSSVT